MAGKSKVDDEAAYAFTSMIDIVFLLLIFFILQPFKTMEQRLDNDLPKDVGPSNSMDNSITCRLVITRNPADPSNNTAIFAINSRRIGTDYATLAQEILRDVKGNRDTTVTLAPQPNVHFVHVIRALDQCHVAEMKKVSFEAPPPPK